MTGHCFDIGNTIAAALDKFEATGEAYSGSYAGHTAGNGSLMRVAPVVLFYMNNHKDCRREVNNYVVLSSKTTHSEARCLKACEVLSNLLHDILLGEQDKNTLIDNLKSYQFECPEILQAIMDASNTKTSRNEIFGRGYVVDSLKAALWCFMNSDDFSQGALLAANLGDDADTTAAIYGQIAGAYYAEEGLPKHWLEKLAWREEISQKAEMLALNGPQPERSEHVFQVRLRDPVKQEPLEPQELPQKELEAMAANCPVLDMRQPLTRTQILMHVQAYFCHTFDAPELVVTESSNVIEDLERFYYAKVEGISQDDVEYKSFIGALSDRGLVGYLAICYELPDTMGFDATTLVEPDFDSYFAVEIKDTNDWETVGDFINSCMAINQAYLAISAN